jgi:4'-phosphopantetheinyl transferase
VALEPVDVVGAVPRVHVYVTTVSEARAAGDLERYRDRLTGEERARHARMRPDPRGDEFVVGRALARHALARHTPGDHVFTAGSHGRLSVAGGAAEFNLSHAEGVVVCAVAEAEIGVDIEKVDEARTEPGIWQHHFAPVEVAALAALPEAARCERFFRYWTLKEAYIKARGLGLSISLQDFWFLLDDPPVRIQFAPALKDDPTRWQFAQQFLMDDFLLAVAVVAAEPVALTVERCRP